MNQTTKETDHGFSRQDLELAQGELRVALAFADYSSAAYSKGKLKRAIDAKSRAKFLCTSAAIRLSAGRRMS